MQTCMRGLLFISYSMMIHKKANVWNIKLWFAYKCKMWENPCINLIIVALSRHMATYNWLNIRSGNGLLPDGNLTRDRLPQSSIIKIRLKITYLKFHSNLIGAKLMEVDSDYISMGWCKKDVTPLLTHWSYVFLALTHPNPSMLSEWYHTFLCFVLVSFIFQMLMFWQYF